MQFARSQSACANIIVSPAKVLQYICCHSIRLMASTNGLLNNQEYVLSDAMNEIKLLKKFRTEGQVQGQFSTFIHKRRVA
jgi:hypothetical protein